VHHAQPRAREQHGGERGAHAVQVGVALHELGDRAVARDHRVAQLAEQVVARLVVVERRQGGDDDLAGHLARGVATHAVGEREQAWARVHGVLVVRTHQTPVTAGRVSEDEGHERSSITVLPIRIGEPSGTRSGAVTFARSR
jgi:hypothetical protein